MLTENGFIFSKLILATGRSDLRKGIDGLAAMVRLKYGLDPLEKDTLFLFCGTRRDRLKGLLWTGDRFILLNIRLVDGCFQWPRTAQEARSITTEEFKRLMEEPDIDQGKAGYFENTGGAVPEAGGLNHAGRKYNEGRQGYFY